jgi:hypothetical protein
VKQTNCWKFPSQHWLHHGRQRPAAPCPLQSKQSPHVPRAFPCLVGSASTRRLMLQSPLLGSGCAYASSFTPPLSGQFLSGRLGMSQTLEAEFAHPHLVDGLIWPSSFGTRLAKDITDGVFPCGFHEIRLGSLGERCLPRS